MVVDVKLSNFINEFKAALASSYRTYLFEISFSDTPPNSKLNFPLTDRDIWKNTNEAIRNYGGFSNLCKSIGKIETEIQDMKVEIQGRENKTGSKLIYKSPLTMQFYDVILFEYKGKNFMLSDFFKWWIERWSLGATIADQPIIGTKRLYLDENSTDMIIKVYPGGFNVDYIIGDEATMFAIGQYPKSYTAIQSSFDRFVHMPTEYMLTFDDGYSFVKSLRGVGAGMTIHGIINTIMMSIIAGFQLGNNIQQTPWYEAAVGTPGGKKMTKESFTPNSETAQPDESLGIFKDYPKYVDAMNKLPFEPINIKTYKPPLNAIDTNLLDKFQTLRNMAQFKNVSQGVETALINPTQFVDNPQFVTALNLLKLTMNTSDISSITPKQIGDAMGIKGSLVTKESLEKVIIVLNTIVDGMKIQQQLFNDEEVKAVKELINQTQIVVSQSMTNRDELQKLKEMMIQSRTIINKINEPLIDSSSLEQYLQTANRIFDMNFLERDSTGGAMGWSQGFSVLMEVAKNIVGTISLIPLLIHVIQNAKTLYNYVGLFNGWDDFINTTIAKGAPTETAIMNNSLSIKAFVQLYTSIFVLSSISDKVQPFTQTDPTMKMIRLGSDQSSLISSGSQIIDPIRQYRLTKVYPTSVSMNDLGHDKVGEQSLPLIDVNFNFYGVSEVIPSTNDSTDGIPKSNITNE